MAIDCDNQKAGLSSFLNTCNDVVLLYCHNLGSNVWSTKSYSVVYKYIETLCLASHSPLNRERARTKTPRNPKKPLDGYANEARRKRTASAVSTSGPAALPQQDFIPSPSSYNSNMRSSYSVLLSTMRASSPEAKGTPSSNSWVMTLEKSVKKASWSLA